MPAVDLNLCMKCFACIPACPNGLISEGPKGPKFDNKKSFRSRGKLLNPANVANGSKCEKCGKCIESCPAGAIKVV